VETVLRVRLATVAEAPPLVAVELRPAAEAVPSAVPEEDQALLDLPAHQESPATPEPRERPVNLANPCRLPASSPLSPRASPAPEASLDSPDHQDHQETLETPASPEAPAETLSQAHPDHQAPQEILEPPDSQDRPDNPEPQHKANRRHPLPQAHQEMPDLRDPPEAQDNQETPEAPEPQDPRDHQDLLAHPETTDNQDNPETLARLETPETRESARNTAPSTEESSSRTEAVDKHLLESERSRRRNNRGHREKSNAVVALPNLDDFRTLPPLPLHFFYAFICLSLAKRKKDAFAK